MKKFYLFLFTIIFFLSTTGLFSQTDKTIAPIDEDQNSPTFTWGSGIGITAPDSVFHVNLRFSMQNLVVTNADEGEISSVDARVRRLRLRFDGFVLTPKLTYDLQFGFANEDMRGYIESNPPNAILDAAIYYSPDKNWRFGFGQTKLPGNRERINSSGALQLVDRSAVNALFNIDRDFGVFANYKTNFKDGIQFHIKTAVSTGEGINWVSSPGTNFSYTGRLEILPFGYFTKNGDFSQGDLAREEKPKLSVAASYNYNQDAERNAGQRGSRLYENRTITNLFADFLFKYNGWSFTAEYMKRDSDDPVTINPDDPEQEVFVYNGTGYFVQAGYNFPCDFEIAGRFSRTEADDEIAEYVTPNSEYYTLGLNQYLKGHSLKIQFDATYIKSSLLNIIQPDESWSFRLQVALGI